MRFQILHESPGRVRLRAQQRIMSMAEANLLEAWILALPGVDQVTVHERICGVTILFRGERDALYGALSRFSYGEAGEEIHVLSPHSRQINREYKEKLVFQVLRHYGKKLFLPLPVRQIINTVNAIPRIWLAAKTLLRGKLTVEVLDGVAIGVSLLTGAFSTAGSFEFLRVFRSCLLSGRFFSSFIIPPFYDSVRKSTVICLQSIQTPEASISACFRAEAFAISISTS